VESVANSTAFVGPAALIFYEHPMLNQATNTSKSEQFVPASRSLGEETGEDVFPLSFMQESLWLVEQMTPNTSTYNLAEAWRLSGSLDADRLRASLAAIAQRHETLRTVLVLRESRPVQQLLPQAGVDWRFIDLSHGPANESDLQRELEADARQRFNLKGALARVSLFRLAVQEHILLLNLHHIISDGWSFRVLMQELMERYEAAIEGRPPRLPELPIQYADFAVWQREMAASCSFEAQLKYWEQRLKQPLPALELPLDHERPGAQSLQGRTQFFTLPKPLVDGLKEISRRAGVTLFMTLLAAFKVLLSRLTRQTDIVVGSPMAGRDRVETEHLIGLFINTHALRTDLSGEPSFLDLLRRVRETVLGATAHQEVPTEQVIQRLNPERDFSRHPLFQTVFGLLNGLSEHLQFAGLRARRIDIDNGGAKFDWSLLLSETADGLMARSEYASDLFDGSTVQQWGHCYETLLSDVVAHPDWPVSRLRILTDAEATQLIARWNLVSTRPSTARSLHEWFEEQVKKVPEATAVVCQGERLRYEELNRRANQLARQLQKLGVGPETPVALYLERSVQMVVALLGVLKAGGLYVPMDPACPKDRLRFMLEDTKAPVLLTQTKLSGQLPETSVRVICLDAEQDKIGQESGEDLHQAVAPENAAYVIYTSGSTGTPKGVVVTHHNVVRLFEQTQHWFGFNSDDVWPLFHSYAFDFSVWEIWGALLNGGRLVIIPYLVSRAADEFFELLVDEGVTVLNQTPSAFRQLIWAEANNRRQRGLKLRYVILGGEALELQSLRPWFERYGDEAPRIVNMFGITETTVHVTYRVIRKGDLESGVGSVIGVPIPDLRLYLLDSALQPVPTGVVGELCVGGAGVARGYLNRAELTSQKFVRDPFCSQSTGRLYRSGDLGRYTASGELEYLGRMDDQVKVRGFRVELGEIESVLNNHPALRESVVVAQRSASGSQRLVAYVVPRQELPSLEALPEHLRQTLPDYMVPELYIPLAKVPLTSNGKVDHRALPSANSAPNSESRPTVLPRTPMEKLIAQNWCEVLGKERVGIDDNFFRVGGHSLSATQVMARLGAALNLELSVRLLFESPTVAGLATAIAKAERQNPNSSGAIPRRTGSAEELLGRLEQLTDAELDELLRQTEDKTLSA
jgi:amino acid adenylation domain-containing protein